MTEAHIKQKDSQTGLTILAVSKDEIHSTTMEEIRIAELGISGDDAIVGQPVIAIGAPQGTYGSVSYGMITANKGRLNLTDASYNLLTTDLNTGTAPSGVLINLEGKVLGVMAGSDSRLRSLAYRILRRLLQSCPIMRKELTLVSRASM